MFEHVDDVVVLLKADVEAESNETPLSYAAIAIAAFDVADGCRTP
jgi:hypothetical protein